jgi:hypothetical protein
MYGSTSLRVSRLLILTEKYIDSFLDEVNDDNDLQHEAPIRLIGILE